MAIKDDSQYPVLTQLINKVENFTELSDDYNFSATLVDIKGTTQSIVFDTDGSVKSIVHKNADNTIARTDSFTYSGNTITEVRTLQNGKSQTFIYHLDTLVTEVL